MVSGSWNDERLDELNGVAKLTARQAQETAVRVAVHDVTLEQHTRAMTTFGATLERLDDKLDTNNAQFRLTPGQKLAAAVPIVGSVATCVAVVLAGSPS